MNIMEAISPYDCWQKGERIGTFNLESDHGNHAPGTIAEASG